MDKRLERYINRIEENRDSKLKTVAQKLEGNQEILNDLKKGTEEFERINRIIENKAKETEKEIEGAE